MQKSTIISMISVLLILLWTYTAFSKLIAIDEFERQLYNQTFNRTTADILLWFLPTSEIIAALLLLFERTRFIGLCTSSLLMLVFTGYIVLVLFGYYDRTPCSCGGVLKNLGWKAHLFFNLFFFILAILGAIVQYKLNRKRGMVTK